MTSKSNDKAAAISASMWKQTRNFCVMNTEVKESVEKTQICFKTIFSAVKMEDWMSYMISGQLLLSKEVTTGY